MWWAEYHLHFKYGYNIHTHAHIRKLYVWKKKKKNESLVLGILCACVSWGNSIERERGEELEEKGAPPKSPAPSSRQQLSAKEREAWEGLFIRVRWLVSPSVLPKWRTSSHHAQQVTSALLLLLSPKQLLRRFTYKQDFCACAEWREWTTSSPTLFIFVLNRICILRLFFDEEQFYWHHQLIDKLSDCN